MGYQLHQNEFKKKGGNNWIKHEIITTIDKGSKTRKSLNKTVFFMYEILGVKNNDNDDVYRIIVYVNVYNKSVCIS